MSVTPDDGRTHWHGCEQERGHHACALAEIDRLRAEADAERICALELRAQLDRVNATAIQRKDELTRLRAELDAMARRAELAEGYAQPYHDEAARLRAELERATQARDRARAERDRAAKLLHGIYALMYPAPIATNDGRAMVFRPQSLDPHAVLQELSDRIRALSDALAQEPPA